MKQRGTLQNIISVTFWKTAGMGLSLIIALAIANLFGAGLATDAFFFARRLVSNAAAGLERAFHLLQVPPLVRLAETRGPDALSVHLRKRLWQVFLAAAVICAAAFVFSEQIVALLAPGFSGAQRQAAETYFRVLLAVLPLSAATALAGATLNALRLFRMPVIARLIPRLCAVAALALVPVFAFGIGAVALAIAAGTVLMAGLFAFCLRQALARSWTPVKTPSPQVPYSQRRIWAMLLSQFHVIGAAWIDMAMASLTGEGGIATLEFAQRMTNMAPGVVTSSVVVVYYTEFASHLAQDNRDAFRTSVQEALRATLFFVMPAAVALFMLNRPLVSALLGHGAFAPWAVAQTAGIVAWLAPLLLVNAVLGALASALFADPRLPHVRIIATSISAALAVRVALNWLLLPEFGILAVPAASLVSMTLLMGLLYFWLIRSHGPLIKLQETWPFAAMAIASAAAAIAIRLAQTAAGSGTAGRVEMILLIALCTLCGGLVYVAAATLLKVPETARIRLLLHKAVRRGAA
ncbi:oligosaccharide flippase family protein [Leisingera daeponensis]|uniref:Oligosaccharide flippase family protein n=1 Tax=Leisingera daeponensis TaxID=405746 RepID=A0ABS7NI40_9RHOB|nr:lipid II flippase MurJ [Leisingera daeponensis]MBY6140864.1 oligosaccharide flippase family protein [Leisingera daeponensis]